MSMIKSSAAVLAAAGMAFALTPMAGAREAVAPQFWLTSPVYAPGDGFGAMIVEGTCPGGAVSLTSPGFASVDLATLHGKLVTAPGSYTATLKCKDTTEEGTFGFYIEVPRNPSQGVFLDKEEYAPGETVKVHEQHPSCEGASAVSDGFVAPAVIHNGYGETKAIDTPGTYVVTFWCAFPGAGFDQFTIKAPTSPPPAGNPKPKPKPPIVKPKGAPQTGGGGTV